MAKKANKKGEEWKGRGGYRGGGRPKGTSAVAENKLESKKFVVKRIYKKKDRITDALIDAATGLYYHDPDKGHVYQKKPDTNVGEYLINQLIGKPKESVEITDDRQLNVDL